MQRSMLQCAHRGSQPRATLIGAAPTVAVAALVVTAALTLGTLGWFGDDAAMMHILDNLGTAISTAAQY